MTDKTKDEVKVMNNQQLKTHFKAAIQYLDDHYAYFLTHVLKIGKPKWANVVPTAAVQIVLTDKNGKFIPGGKTDDIDYDNFDFVFNPQFASQLDTEGLAFVLAHETMHILLNHLRLSGTFVDREKAKKLTNAKEKGKRLSKDEIKELIVQQQNAMRFNIAADCVINDYLASAGFKVLDMAMRGHAKVGTDCSMLTVREVYDMLEEQGKQGKDDDCESCGGDGQEKDENGDPTGEECEDCKGSGKQPGAGQPGMGGVGGSYEQMDSHDWMLDPEYAEKLADAIDKLNDKVEADKGLPGDIQDMKDQEAGQATKAQKALQKSMQAGTEDGNMQDFIEQSGANLAWAKLLKEIDPNMFKEPGIAPPPLPSFHNRRRKLQASQFKKIHLPVYRIEERHEKLTREKPAIVLALDTSGSIGPTDAQRFVSLAKSIPTERIKLFCCTFEYNYVEIDPQSVGRISAGGGTNFDSIPNFINDRVKPELKGAYPKAVVIITDGYASLSHPLEPTEDEAKGWLWLISPADAPMSYPASGQFGRRMNLDEFIVE